MLPSLLGRYQPLRTFFEHMYPRLPFISRYGLSSALEAANTPRIWTGMGRHQNDQYGRLARLQSDSCNTTNSLPRRFLHLK